MLHFFQHAVLSWTIENSSFLRRCRRFILGPALPFKERVLESPQFDVIEQLRRYRTTWKLSLVLNKIEDNYVFSLHLKFLYGTIYEFKNYRGFYKITYIDNKNEVRLEKQFTFRIIRREEIICENFLRLRDLISDFKLDTDGSYQNIICEMILIDGEQTRTNSIAGNAEDIGKNSLSLDIQTGYKESLMTDVTLRMQDGEIRAHKAVLYARSKYFEGILTPETDVIDLANIKTDVLNTVLEFTYSGDYSCLYLGNPPLIGMYECAQKLGISDLEYFLAPASMKVKTFVPLNQHAFDWYIDDFFLLYENNRYVSPFLVFSGDCYNLELRSFTSENSSKHLFLDFIYSLRDTPDLFVEIYFIDNSGNIFYKQEKLLTLEPDKGMEKPITFDFSNLLSEEYSMYLADNFTLRFKIAYPAKDYISNMEVSEPKFSTFFYENSKQRLCNDMLKLYKSSHLSDVDFLLRGEIFKAHKCILAMRSPYYHGMFKNDCIESRMGKVKLDLDSVSLDILLKYIYSGIIIYENSNIFCGRSETLLPLNTSLDLYEASDMNQLKSLKTIFSHYWLYALDNSTDVLFDILPYVCAYNDRESMITIVDYLFGKGREIFETQEWVNFIRKNSQLNEIFQEIKAFIERSEQMQRIRANRNATND